MKNLQTLSVLLLTLFFTNNTYAKIWRVNNTAGVVADFTDLQSAHNAAVAGDTIHVEPSVSNYTSLTLTKRLVIIGNGYLLTIDTGLQANTNNSAVASGITFNPGSSGSTIQGLTLAYYTYVEDSNITIRRCFIQYPVYVYSSKFTFVNNYIYNYGVSEQVGNLTGINISNNIFYYYSGITFGSTSTGNFTNNTCNASGISCYNFQVNNNILLGGAFTVNNNVYFNNISDGILFGTANGNQQNVLSANIFTQTGAYNTHDAYWQLKVGSPAIGAGYGGVDCGAFGGPNPYHLAGIPSVPTIYKLTVPPVGTTNINVTISTRSNN